MKKKILLILGFIILIGGITFLSYPKTREKTRVFAVSVGHSVSRAISRAGKTLTGSSVAPVTINNCTYKEFSDIPSSRDQSWGWAYWYFHSAKQSGVINYSDTDCNGGTINANPNSQVITSTVCQMLNSALGASVSCPSGDGDDYDFWTRYMNIADIKQDLAERLVSTNNPTFPAGSTAPSWNESGCVCETEWLGDTWTCDACEQNAASPTGTCLVGMTTYTPTCSNRANLVSLIDYNTNKTLAYKIYGSINVANNARPVSDLNGTRLDLYELSSTGAPSSSPVASTTTTFDGTNQNFEIDFQEPIQDFITRVPGKQFELFVSPGSDQFYPDARVFSFTNVATNINFSLLWKEDFASTTFADINTNHWAYWYITAMAQTKAMGGFGGNFYPDSTVTRARTALYSTIAKGNLPCCGLEGDEGTSMNCQTCSGYQTYADLTPDNYFWGYAQSALLSGTMQGYYDQETDTRTFRPVENIPQEQVKWTMEHVGIVPQTPPNYQPAYSDKVPVTRAQMAAWYAWNFDNVKIKIEATGDLAVQNNEKPVNDLVGATLDVMDGATTLGSATIDQISSNRYHVTFSWTLKELYMNVLSHPNLALILSKDGFHTESEAFTVTSTNVETDFTVAVQPTVTFHGLIKYKSDCAEGVQALDGIRINAQSLNNGNPAVFTGHYDTSTKTIPYTVTLESVPQFDGANELPQDFEFAPTKDGVEPTADVTAVQPGVHDVNYDITVVPSQVNLKGRVYDQKTFKPIPHTEIDFNDLPVAETDIAGYFKIRMNPTHDHPIPGTRYFDILANDTGYQFRISQPVDISACPNQYADFQLDRQPVCETINSVKICWFGTEAQEWQKNTDSTYRELWGDLANKINSIYAKTNYKPKGINIVSGSYNGWALHAGRDNSSVFGGWVQLGTTLMKHGGLEPPSNSPLDQNVLSHETGHLYFEETPAHAGVWSQANFDFWKGIFNQGNQINHWANITDASYSGFGGHPSDNLYETFASTFFIMDNDRAEFRSIIDNEPAGDMKNWLNSIYDWHANHWQVVINRIRALAKL